jgi:leucyl aminopeptidase (aminopeptidase T)
MEYYMEKLRNAARTALQTSIKLTARESLMILTDDNKKRIGEAFYEEGRIVTEDILMVVMPAAEVNGQAPPTAVADLMSRFDVVICPTTKSVTHTDAKRNACNQGSRVVTMPGITEDCMVRTLKADYNRIAERTYKISEILEEGKSVHISTSLGTDLTMSIDGIEPISSTGLIDVPGKGGNLPSGESFLMPVEGSTNGVAFIDGALAGIGKIESGPVKVVIKDGFATEISGGREAEQLVAQLDPLGHDARNIAELGIGTNHEARVTGMILEDEKVMGTVHIAFGNNISMGGTFNVGVHIDGVIMNPTVRIDDRLILDNGKLLAG